MKKSIFLLTALSVVVFFTACDNLNSDSVNEISDEITIAELEVSSLKSIESVDEEVDAAKFAGNFTAMYKPNFIIPRSHFGNHFPDCATVTVERDSFPKKITIVYGEGCVTRRGLEKSGKVIITLSDSLKTPGSTYTVEYEDLTIGKKAIDLFATYTYEGLNVNGNHLMNWEMNSTTTMRDSIVITRSSVRTKEWIDGFDTPKIDDDKFFLTGGGEMTVNDTYNFSRVITDPLYIDRACRFILSGVVEITRNEELMIIDFGEGECDNIAIVTKDGESEEIELISEKFRNSFKRKMKNMRKDKGWW